MPIAPPSALLADCKATDVPIKVGGDLVLALRASRADLLVCNADKAALRKWVKDVKAK